MLRLGGTYMEPRNHLVLGRDLAVPHRRYGGPSVENRWLAPYWLRS
jgi:hypothetical protein